MEHIDIWVNCFFGSVDSSHRRLCQYDGHYGTAECDRECPFYLTKRDAIDIVKEVIRGERQQESEVEKQECKKCQFDVIDPKECGYCKEVLHERRKEA